MQKDLTALRRLSIAAVVGMYLVVFMGSLVTNTESGDGCGRSWPLCHGGALPLPTIESLIEYSHRAVTGIVGILVFAAAIWAYRKLRHRPETNWLVFVAIFFLIVESGLGAATVLWPEPPEVLALHMGISLLSFAGVFLLAVLIVQIQNGTTHRTDTPSASFRRLVWVTAIWMIITIYLGAYVRHAAPGISCQGWPLCNGQLIPAELYGSILIQYVHRVASGLFILLTVALFWLARRYRQSRPDLYRGALYVLLFNILQNLSGAFVVFEGAQVLSIMVHSSILPLVFGSLSYLCMQIYPDKLLSATRSHHERSGEHRQGGAAFLPSDPARI